MADSLGASMDVIGEALGPNVEEILQDGLPEGSHEEWGYDEQLVHEIASAILGWKKRKPTQA